MEYSRQNPSPRYLALLEEYKLMHDQGSFPGLKFFRFHKKILRLIKKTDAKTLLDYGSGKGEQYIRKFTYSTVQSCTLQELWGVTRIRCYDPAYEPFAELPKGPFDGVICTDVLEHIPEEDLDWVLEEIFSNAKKFVFIHVACHKAKKILPSGENPHCTVHPPKWWLQKVSEVFKRHPHLVVGLDYYKYPERKQGLVILRM